MLSGGYKMTDLNYLLIALSMIGLFISILKTLSIRRKNLQATNFALGAAAQAHGGKVSEMAVDLLSITTKKRLKQQIKLFIYAIPFFLCSTILSLFHINIVINIFIPVGAVVVGIILVIIGLIKKPI
jgi:hypothetical protein